MWLNDWAAALPVLDELEDEGTLYRRVAVEAATPDGPVTVWTYEFLGLVDAARDVTPEWTMHHGER